MRAVWAWMVITALPACALYASLSNDSSLDIMVIEQCRLIRYVHMEFRTFKKSSTTLEISSENAKSIELGIVMVGLVNY